jgi:hypothetical protein
MPTTKTQNEFNRLEDKLQKETDDLRTYLINNKQQEETQYTDVTNAIINLDTYVTFLTFLIALLFISVCIIGVLVLN